MSILADLRELAAELHISGDVFAAVRLETLIAKHDPPEVAREARPQLTDRQVEILAFIKAGIAIHGRPPTLREICGRFGYRSTNGANDHLVALERKGYIVRDKLLARGMRVVP